MTTKFQKGIMEIRSSEKPISKAWEISCEHLGFSEKMKKLIEIIENHENLFVNHNFYHNHFHLAETVFCSAMLVKEEIPENVLYENALVILLAASFHDVDHKGRANKEPFELEKVSASFFNEWWKNNSLFVENILSIPPKNIEEVVIDLILFTEFSFGQEKVKADYINRKEYSSGILYPVKLKKILTEADFLLNVLPFSAYEKAIAILSESRRNLTDGKKWEMIYGFLNEADESFFTSDASEKLKISHIVKKFKEFVYKNKNQWESGSKFCEEINKKVKSL